MECASQDDGLRMSPPASPNPGVELTCLESPDVVTAIEALNRSRVDFERDASAREKQELSGFQADLTKHLDTIRNSRDYANRAVTESTWTTRLQSSYDRFSKTAFHFAKHLDAVAVVAPSYVQAAWGAVHLLLMVQINYAGFNDCIERQLDQITKEMDHLRAMTSYASNAIATQALSDVYKAYLEFLKEAIKASADTRLKRLLKGLIPPERRLQPLIDDITSAVRNAQKIGNVAMMKTNVDNHHMLTQVVGMLMEIKRDLHFEHIRLNNAHNTAAKMGGMFFEHSETLSVKSKSQQSTSHGAASDTRAEDPAVDDRAVESKPSILDELDDILDGVVGRHSSSLEIAATSTPEGQGHDFPAFDAEARSVSSWLEADGSGVLQIEGHGPHQQLVWNVAIVDCIISDIVKSHPSTATLRFHSSRISPHQDNLTPTAVLQVFIVQLLRQYKESLIGKDLPSRQDLERASRDFSRCAELLRCCISKCSVRNIIVYIDRVDRLCFDSVESQQPVDLGTLQDLFSFIGELSNRPELVIKAILTADTRLETEVHIKPDPDQDLQFNLPEKMNLQLILSDRLPQKDQQPTETYQQTLQRYLDFTSSQSKSLSFADLWMIYQPNTVVYTLDQGNWRALVIIDMASTDGIARRVAPVTLRCWRVALHNGRLSRVIEHCEVEYFSGPLDVQNLRYIPAQFAPSNGSIASSLTKRGTSFCHYSSGHHYLELRGPYAEKRSNDGVCRVMVDTQRHYEETGSREVGGESSPIELAPLQPGGADSGENFKPIVRMTCPKHIPAYDLKNNVWIEVEVDLLQEIPVCTRGILNSLDLRDQSQDTLIDTAQYYLDGRKVFRSTRFYNESEYMTHNSGMLTLLHGPPASGMTYTVEVLAEYFRRPVVRVLGSIINDDQNSQQRLRGIFESAHRWNAFIIMKDVDFFFHEYDGANNIARASVSSLVRELVESFTGMLYVVTHRVRMFDAAHFSLFAVNVEFQPWSAERRYMVLKSLLEQVGYTEEAEDWLEVDSWLQEELSREETLDIRRMRNLVTVASIRAKAGSGPLRRFELKHAARMNTTFGRRMIDERLARSDHRAGRS